MNNNPSGIGPMFNSPYPYQGYPMNGYGYVGHPQHNVVRAKPPSYSQAPWDVTRWVDPVENRNRRHRKSKSKRKEKK